jgi:hypothetical protein
MKHRYINFKYLFWNSEKKLQVISCSEKPGKQVSEGTGMPKNTIKNKRNTTEISHAM